eukprot:scaffold102642_cov16-Tisochrysis_lutea.AAC.2
MEALKFDVAKRLQHFMTCHHSLGLGTGISFGGNGEGEGPGSSREKAMNETCTANFRISAHTRKEKKSLRRPQAACIKERSLN